MSSDPTAGKQTTWQKHNRLFSFLIRIGVTAAVLAILFLFVVTIRIWHQNDMYPAVRDGELVLFLRPGRINAESVVLYRTEDGAEHMGRIAAMEGEEVEIMEDSGVRVNGNIAYQTVPYHTPPGTVDYPYIVPEDSYFILGDYREQETDSRTYGAIRKDQIIGTLIFAMQIRGF